MASSSFSYLWPVLRSTQHTILCVRYAHACLFKHAHPWVHCLIKSWCNAGRDRDEHQPVMAEEALWTFDTTALTWQQRHPSGPLPDPRHVKGLAVVKDHAYLLVSQPVIGIGGRMEVYELDLAMWEWRLLPCTGSIPPCLHRISPVVVQVQNLLQSFNLTFCSAAVITFACKQDVSGCVAKLSLNRHLSLSKSTRSPAVFACLQKLAG